MVLLYVDWVLLKKHILFTVKLYFRSPILAACTKTGYNGVC